MRTTLKKCPRCKTIFSAPEGMICCSKCVEEEHDYLAKVEEAVLVDGLILPAEIAESTGLDLKIVKKILDANPSLSLKVEIDDLCPTCKRRSIARGKEFCALCLMHLDSDIAEVKEELVEKMRVRESKPEARLRRMGVVASINEKRDRAGGDRLNPVPQGVKGRH